MSLSSEVKPKPPTSKDVARISGVSQSTVSRVFSHDHGVVRDEVRQKVIAVANQIGYKPNLVARGMSSGRTNIVALVIGENLGPYYNTLIGIFINEIQNMGKQCLMFQITRQNNVDDIISKVVQFQVEAAIITASAMSENVAKVCKMHDVPIILYNRFVPNLAANMLYSEPLTGGALVARHLCERGHRNIGYVGFVKSMGEEIEKKFGFHSVIREYGVYTVVEEKVADYTYESGYEIATKMLKKNKDLTAVFCTSDIVALGFMDAAKKEFGLKIPEDLSIIGYDDVYISQWKSYNLTTVQQPVKLMVERTLQILEKVISKENSGYTIEMLKPTLIERGSVADITDK